MDDRGGVREGLVARGTGFGEAGVVHHRGVCGGGAGSATAFAFAWGTERGSVAGGGTGDAGSAGWDHFTRDSLAGVAAVCEDAGEGVTTGTSDGWDANRGERRVRGDLAKCDG